MLTGDIASTFSIGTVEQVRHLIEEKGVDVNDKYDNGRTPLHEAARYGNIEMVKFLVSKGADIHLTSSDGFTSLHYAAFSGVYAAERIEVAKFLISKGADINARTNEGNTPIALAKDYNCSEMVEYLKSVGKREAEEAVKQREREERELNELNQAIKRYTEELSNNPNDEQNIKPKLALAHYNRGYNEQKEFKAAIADLNEAVKLEPTNSLYRKTLESVKKDRKVIVITMIIVVGIIGAIIGLIIGAIVGAILKGSVIGLVGGIIIGFFWGLIGTRTLPRESKQSKKALEKAEILRKQQEKEVVVKKNKHKKAIEELKNSNVYELAQKIKEELEKEGGILENLICIMIFLLMVVFALLFLTLRILTIDI